MMLLGPRSDVIPADSVVDREIRPDAPAVLRENSAIRGTLVKRRRRLLRVKIGKSKQEISETVAGGLSAAPKKRERSVGNQVGVLFHLVPGVLKACLHGVVA